EKGKLESRQVELKNLLSDRAFDGLYFRVVKSSGKEAIPFDGTDPTVLMRAATAYHYLTVARESYAQIFKSAGLPEQPQLSQRITVRIDQDKDYSEVSHFTTQHVRNGALS